MFVEARFGLKTAKFTMKSHLVVMHSELALDRDSFC